MSPQEEARLDGWTNRRAGLWWHATKGIVFRTRGGWGLHPWASITRAPYRSMLSAMTDASTYRTRQRFGGKSEALAMSMVNNWRHA